MQLMPPQILAFSAHRSQIKSMERAFGGNRKVALILSMWRGDKADSSPASMRNLRDYIDEDSQAEVGDDQSCSKV